MGLASAPHIFQSIMTEMFCDLDYVLVYIDDILILQQENKTEDDHLDKLKEYYHDYKTKAFEPT